MRVEGFFETLSGPIAKGWAVGLEGDEARQVSLEVIVGDRSVATFVASDFRQDLLEAGFGNGYHAFEYDLSDFLDPNDQEVRVQIRETLTLTEIRAIDGSVNVYRPRSKRFTPSIEDLLWNEPQAKVNDLKNAKNLAIFATYSRSGSLYSYHVEQLRQLRAAGYTVILVHSSDNGASLDIEADALINKKNIGYDFGGYWLGLKYLREVLELGNSLDHLLLLNDSCFGAVSAQNVARLQMLNADFVGATDTYQVTHHLQSYCVMAKGDLARSGALETFIFDYGFPQDKIDVIHEGEIALSRRAREFGFEIAALFPYDKLAQAWKLNLRRSMEDSRAYYVSLGFPESVCREDALLYLQFLRKLDSGFPFNPTHLFWSEILDAGGNFVKKELILKNPLSVPDVGLRVRRLFDTNVISYTDFTVYLVAERINARYIL